MRRNVLAPTYSTVFSVQVLNILLFAVFECLETKIWDIIYNLVTRIKEILQIQRILVLLNYKILMFTVLAPPPPN